MLVWFFLYSFHLKAEIFKQSDWLKVDRSALLRQNIQIYSHRKLSNLRAYVIEKKVPSIEEFPERCKEYWKDSKIRITSNFCKVENDHSAQYLVREDWGKTGKVKNEFLINFPYVSLQSKKVVDTWEKNL